MPTDLVPDNEPVSILASGVFDLNGFSETIGSLSGETGSRVLLGTGALITGGDGTSTVFSGVISGSGAVTKNGAGTMTINGPAASTFTGPTTVQGGSLTLDFTNLATRTNLIAGASALVLNGGALNVKGNASGTTTQTFNGLTVKPGRSAAVLDANGGAATNLALGPITRSIGGTVDFSLSARCSITTTAGNDATGILGGWATVSGADWASAAGSGSPRSVVAYTGYIDNVWATGNNTTVTANSGAPAGSTTNSLRFAGAGARTVTLSGTNVIASGGILVAPSVGANLTQILGGSVAGAAGKDLVVLQNNVSGGLTIGSVVANNGTATGLTKSGGGTLALTGSNTYTGPTTINDGTLQVSRDNNLGAASAPLQFNGGTLETSLGFTSSRPITLDLQGGTVNTREFSVTLAGAITGSASLTKTGTGTLRLSGSNSYGGTTTVGGGTLQLGQSSAIPQASAVNVISGARLDASAIATTIGSLQGGGAVVLGSGSLTTGGDNTSTTFSGVISGAARVTKTGIGSLTFTGSSTYTGPTTVVAGKLLVSSPGTLVSPVTVGSGATLAGTGTVGGVTVNPGGHLAPGNSIGTLTLTGGLSLANGAKLDFELGALGSNDLISMPSSTLTLSGQQFADFTFTPLSGFGPGTYTLIDARGINGGLGLITTGTINGLSATLAVDTVHNDLVLNVVPEPGTLALLAIGALSLVALTRFRRTGRV
jgi:autotransporter-associated beta strand protein